MSSIVANITDERQRLIEDTLARTLEANDLLRTWGGLTSLLTSQVLSTYGVPDKMAASVAAMLFYTNVLVSAMGIDKFDIDMELAKLYNQLGKNVDDLLKAEEEAAKDAAMEAPVQVDELPPSMIPDVTEMIQGDIPVIPVGENIIDMEAPAPSVEMEVLPGAEVVAVDQTIVEQLDAEADSTNTTED